MEADSPGPNPVLATALALSGSNTNTGAVTISAGTLLINGSGRLGGGNYAANIINNGTFKYNSSRAQTLSGVISLEMVRCCKRPRHVDDLQRANTYGGNTIITGGTLVLGAGGLINNSPIISVGSGATLNASASGLAVDSGQVLTGAGTVAWQSNCERHGRPRRKRQQYF